MIRKSFAGRVRRPGFTLIELLVAIGIIAVLIGLLLAAVVAVLQVVDRRTTQYEISKLDEGMKVAMRTQYGDCKTLPGKLVLYNNIAIYRDVNPTVNFPTLVTNVDLPDLKRTKDVLRRMFGNRFIQSGQLKVSGWDGKPPTAGNTLPDQSAKFTLEGHACLVFYLGGIPTYDPNGTTPVKMQGFGSDALDPSNFSGGTIGPFYTDFKSNRLQTNKYNTPQGMYHYLDPYLEMPYAYFGGTGSANSYASITSGCASLGVDAYQESAGKYTNPNSFQIISAGKNKVFGPGGMWNPTTGVTGYNGEDDLANFSQSVLGSPQS